MAGDPIYLELGGEQKELRYNWKSIKRLRKEQNINLFSTAHDEIYEEPDTISALLWAALIWENKDLTMDAVDELIELDQVAAISGVLGGVLSRDMGVEQTEDPLP